MTNMRFLLPLGIAAGIIILVPLTTRASTVADLQTQIDAHNAQIQSLEADIAAYQRELDSLGTKKSTLQSTIDSLTISQKQLASQIQVTQNKISTANLRIQELSMSIGDKEDSIAVDQHAIAKALRSIAEGEQPSLVLQIISSQSIADVWRSADQSQKFNAALMANILDLRSARTELATNLDQVSAVKADLVRLQNDLTLQKRSVDASKTAQQQLLTQTKNQESNYQKLILQKKAAEKAFEQKLADLQSQLDLIVHPGSLPKVGTGVLSWPFSFAFMQNCTHRSSVFGNNFCITQFFGNTPFATANPQVYSGGGHEGIDIGSPIGTPVQAAKGGTVIGAGNTDLIRDTKGRQCYSFGKWVMIDHHNGLNTLYAHLSTIDVTKGQTVQTGQIIGLAGMTGYATGPHLHFGVYATEGTKIMDLGQFRGSGGTPCTDGGALIPVATKDAYLNPLSYL